MGCFTESNWRFVTDAHFGCLPSSCGPKPLISQWEVEHSFILYFKLNFPNGSEFWSLRALLAVCMFYFSVLWGLGDFHGPGSGSERVWVCTRSRLHPVSSSLFVVCCVDWVLQALHLINWPICFPNFLWHSLETDHIDGKDTHGCRHALGLFPMKMQWSAFKMHPC